LTLKIGQLQHVCASREHQHETMQETQVSKDDCA
jgi:hypothetical protein